LEEELSLDTGALRTAASANPAAGAAAAAAATSNSGSASTGHSAAAAPDSRSAAAHPLWTAIDPYLTPPSAADVTFLRELAQRVAHPAELAPRRHARAPPRPAAEVASERDFADAMRAPASEAGEWRAPLAAEVAGPLTERLLAVGWPSTYAEGTSPLTALPQTLLPVDDLGGSRRAATRVVEASSRAAAPPVALEPHVAQQLLELGAFWLPGWQLCILNHNS
jgi:hypothetical protein